MKVDQIEKRGDLSIIRYTVGEDTCDRHVYSVVESRDSGMNEQQAEQVIRDTFGEDEPMVCSDRSWQFGRRGVFTACTGPLNCITGELITETDFILSGVDVEAFKAEQESLGKGA